MKTIPRIGGSWWPACALIVTLLLLPFFAMAQESEEPGEVEQPDGADVAADDTDAGLSAGETELLFPESTESTEQSAGETEDSELFPAEEEIIEEPSPVEEIEITPLELPDDPIEALVKTIQHLPEGSRVMIAFNFDSSNETDLYAASIAVLRQCFDNNLRVLAFTTQETELGFMEPADEEAGLSGMLEYFNGTLGAEAALEAELTQTQLDWLDHLKLLYFGEPEEDADEQETPEVDAEWLERMLTQPVATTYIETAFKQMEKEYSIEYGFDFINCGYFEANKQVVTTAKGVDFVIDIASGNTPAWWIDNLVIPDGIPLGIIGTYASAGPFSDYFKTGVINGLLQGLSAIADYEGMIGYPGKATKVLPHIEDLQLTDSITVEDRPSDEGGALSVQWASAEAPEGTEPSDSKFDDATIQWGIDPASGDPVETPVFEYWVYHSPTGEADSWELTSVVGSTSSYTWEANNYFGFFLSDTNPGSNDHYLFFENTYPETGVYEYRMRYSDLPPMKGISSLADFDYIVVISEGDTIDLWLDNGTDVPIAIGCPFDLKDEYAGYIEDGRIDGVIAGLPDSIHYGWIEEAIAEAEAEAKAETEAESAEETSGDDPDEAGEGEDEEAENGEEEKERAHPAFTMDYMEASTLDMEIMAGLETAEMLTDEELEKLTDEELEALEEIDRDIDPLVQFVHGSIDALETPPEEIEEDPQVELNTILVVVDYGEDTQEELDPVTQAILSHCFDSSIKVVSLSLIEEGADIIHENFEAVKGPAGAVYSKDFINLGYKEGGEQVIEDIADAFQETFPLDYYLASTEPDMLLRISALVYDEDITDYASMDVHCSLKPFGGEKIKLEYIPSKEDAEPWENLFQTIIPFDNMADLKTTKPYYIPFSADIGGKRNVVLETQPKKDSADNIIKIDASDGEMPVADNRDKHYFRIYAVPLGYTLPDDQELPPDKWLIGTNAGGAVAKENLWNGARTNTFLWAIFTCATVMWFIFRARKGASLFVRRIAGLDHVEEAIGRATEMGRPILYTTGLGSVADIATIASMNILGRVARRVAKYDTRLINPHKDPIVMTVCQEVVQEAYIDSGRPDSYNKDDVFFITDDQFAYTAAVSGIMIREKPATIILMGMFFAESLLLAETGSQTGAIQIAGTDALAQLPFFITACDYTLIGEELYAASAYLSKEPVLLGALKGNDLSKMVFMIIIALGTIWFCLGALGVPLPNPEFFKQLFQVF